MDRRTFLLGASALSAAASTNLAWASEPARVRRSVGKMANTDQFFSQYAEAVRRMRALPPDDPRSWRNQALIHLRRCSHGVRDDFTHWHRHYLVNFEKVCGELIGDPTFSLAYWNWSENGGRLPEPFFDIDLLNVEKLGDTANDSSPNWAQGALVITGPRRWLTKTRGLQDDPRFSDTFTSDSIARIKRLSDFRSFCRRLEQSPHNAAHIVCGATGGHMGDGMSPLDPAFWLHHCNVDRIWTEWQAAGNASPALTQNYAEHFVDEKGKPVNASSASALNVEQLGYTYDSLVAVARLPRTNLAMSRVLNQSAFANTELGNTPVMLGRLNTQRILKDEQIAAFSVATNDLLDNLFTPRSFLSVANGEPRLSAETARVLGRLKGVSVVGASRPFVVNVWVNCPYAGPELVSADHHYAGTFAFFGGGEADEITVDLTKPLQELAQRGSIADDRIDIQLVGVPIDRDSAFEGEIKFQGVDIVRV